jgi:hypothetical protein
MAPVMGSMLQSRISVCSTTNFTKSKKQVNLVSFETFSTNFPDHTEEIYQGIGNFMPSAPSEHYSFPWHNF